MNDPLPSPGQSPLQRSRESVKQGRRHERHMTIVDRGNKEVGNAVEDLVFYDADRIELTLVRGSNPPQWEFTYSRGQM